MIPTLTICIPTFNRALRLEKTLANILNLIISLKLEDQIGVFVSNNSSEDHTEEILTKFFNIAEQEKIAFNFQTLKENVGIAKNTIECALRSNSNYIVYIGDDDNFYEESLLQILKDISEFKPNVIIYNFDQKPWDQLNPLIRKREFISDPAQVGKLNSLVKWYKLCGLVLKVEDKSKIQMLRDTYIYSKFFGHVLLAVIIMKNNGKLLLCPEFIAYPDQDYMEHVNFAPYVSELMYLDLLIFYQRDIISENEFNELTSRLPRQSVISRSIYRLFEFYSGSFPLTAKMKKQLWKNVFDGIFLKKAVSSEGLPLKVEFKDILRLIRLFLSVVAFEYATRIRKIQPKIRGEGF
jgi:glycosyltransferase involved in cell wall biosynthesis